MCNKAVENYPHVPECYKTQVFHSIPDKNKTQEICNLAVSLYPPFIVYFPYKYMTQEMCDEADDDSLAVLKPITDWFATNQMITKFFTALHQMKRYSILLQIVVILHLIIMKWVLLILILMILILTIVLMKMILILLFSSDFK